MPTHARNKVVREGEIANYHCWSRCVQRAFLCGEDSYTGRNFDYRREWIEQLIEYLAGVFAVDVANHSVLSNHMHLVVRTRPDIVTTWSDEEVACRWKLAWPKWDGTQWSRKPTDEEIQELLLDTDRMALARRGLGSLSWFMARCKEPIARLANDEMETQGHFWEQRFGCREIADEGALLTCMVYVDVNQIKAGLAASLEESHCSGIAARLAAWRAREAQASYDAFHDSRNQEFGFTLEQVESLLADSWLAPISATGPLMTDAARVPAGDDSTACGAASSDTLSPLAGSNDQESAIACPDAEDTSKSAGHLDDSPKAATDSEVSGASAIDSRAMTIPLEDSSSRTIYDRLFGDGRARRRVSDSPILPLPFSQYREIVQWVADQILLARARRPAIPSWLEQFLRSHGMDPDNWLNAVEQFENWFGRAVGSMGRLRQLLDLTGSHWVHGIGHCRTAFG